ncbi:tol-pal system protein YbgF [Desulfoluna sp.]|uniref:tol-pal system protein YbgF n=1 Tax=Desulfoluna sp. TaxID=2045199 RepID=UPI0026318A90|nr:tol-pal system protein YbgF [Desulfoluna sp.]
MKPKVIACLLVGLFFSGCALQKDYIALQGRITSIEDGMRENQALSQGVEDSVASKNARLANKIEKIQEELRIVRGDMETALHHSEQLSTRNIDLEQTLGKIRLSIDALSKKLSRLETFTGYEPSDTAPQKPTAQASDHTLYMNAKKAFDAGEMDTAKKGFTSVVETFPASDNADNAQFWIGEIYYREKWYQKAILEYQKVIENYPKGNKVPAAYLKQGLAFEALGETENAHLILGELLRKYPDTSESSIARKKLGQ